MQLRACLSVCVVAIGRRDAGTAALRRGGVGKEGGGP